MSKRIKILTPRIYEHSDFFHNAYDFAREKSLNTNELCLELSHYLVEHFDKVWKIEKPRIYKQISDLQSQLQQANEIINNPDTLIFQQQQLIDNLQSQLAEKDKEIEELKESNEFTRKLYEHNYNVLMDYKSEKYGLEKTIQELRKIKLSPEEKEIYYKGFENCERQMSSHIVDLQKEQNQKAIEQLEKVKAELVKLGQDYSLNLCGIKIYNFVDDQINELKGE